MTNQTGDSCPLDIMIAQTQRELLQSIADAVEPMGWRCCYVELYIEDGLPTANVRMAILRTNDDEDATCRVCGCTDEVCGECVEHTGEPCRWVEADLCSACAPSAAAAG